MKLNVQAMVEEAARTATLRHVHAIQAKALRAAADDIYGDNGPEHPLSVATWLRARADAIEAVDR